MRTRNMKARGIALLLSIPVLAHAERTVKGTITHDGSGASGLKVEAWDGDPSTDDKMGSAITASDGKYEIHYEKHRWDPNVVGTNFKRPDIYIRVKRHVEGWCDGHTWQSDDKWLEIRRSGTTQDHPMANDLTKNLSVTFPSFTHGEADIGVNMFCDVSFLHVSCFACIGDKKISWTEYGVSGMPTIRHPCSTSTSLPNCTKADRDKIKELNQQLGDPGSYD